MRYLANCNFTGYAIVSDNLLNKTASVWVIENVFKYFEMEMEQLRAHLSVGRFKEALAEAEDLSRRFPGVPDPNVCRGLAFAALEGYEEELSAY
jgi:hypothetical protein